ncbi:MAG: ATPase [Novosphingobium sp.]|nr:ATPase [Novosphingobium sp.]
MNGGSRIIAFGGAGDGQAEQFDQEPSARGEEQAAPADVPLDLGAWVEDTEYAQEPAPDSGMAGRLPAILALVAIAGWTGFYMWANRTFASASTVPSEWAYLIASWTMPVLLVCVIWLIVMRSSTREASRFGNAARLLSDESALLESRLLTVNRELSLAREFIAAQSRDLESLGRVASERLSTNADRLQALVSENGDRVETIGQVSAAALENMEKLRGQLPVIASSAKDVTNNIGNAGRTAHSQIEEMIRGFQRLNEFGQASENQVISLRDHVNETLSGLFEQCGQLERVAASRFAELGKQSDDLRNHLDRHEIDALAAIRTRTNALAEELDTARTASAQAEHDLLETMSARIAALREEGETLARSLRENEVGAQEAWTDTMRLLASEIEERSQVHARAADIAAERAAELAGKLSSAQSEIARIASDTQSTEERIDEALARVNARMAEMKASLADTETRLGTLTDSGLRLFELVHASSEKAGDSLPNALRHSDEALGKIEARAGEIAVSIGRIGEDSAAFAARLDESRSVLSDLAQVLQGRQDQIGERAGEHQATLDALSRSLDQIDQRHEAVAAKARTQLAESIAEMEGAARETLALIDQQGSAGIDRIADDLRSRSADAVSQAIHNASSEISGQLEQAASHAAGISREATIQLRDQLAKVLELVANLENRVDRARERAEEQVDNDFARRAALITESLNSHAIDIAKAFSADVSDSAWEGYLRGDRSIFTRRSLTLIEASEAKSILQIFERDDEFRELVSRYIHDFESMLRQVLSTRDGKALGVTLLSSDMGKLYVSLAQAIQRLRT